VTRRLLLLARTLSVCALFSLVATSSSQADETAPGSSMPLVADGRPLATVVIGKQPPVEVRTAATWFVETIEQMSAARIPIAEEAPAGSPVVRIIADPALPSEAWSIRSDSNSLTLSGGLPRGVMYALCDFLEWDLGVSRLDPWTELVPKRTTITIPTLKRSGRPAFEFRSVFTGWPYTRPAPTAVNNARWRVWNKEQLFAPVEAGDVPRMLPDGVHTLGLLIKPAEFAKEHPEYFAVDAEGKRQTDDKGQPQLWQQPCVTNRDVRRITLERVRKQLADDRADCLKSGRQPAPLVVLSQNDNTTNLCLCPDCKAISDREGSESGLLHDYIGEIARALAPEYPDVVVLTDAYNFTLAPPKTVRPEKNVLVRYCDNYGLSDMTRPLADPRNAERLALLEGWRKTGASLGLWDYWRVFEEHPPGMFTPSTNVRAAQADLRLLRDLKARFVTIECEDFLGGGVDSNNQTNDLQSFMPLRAWIGMKLMDNPDHDLGRLLDRFCAGYYGGGAASMRELLELIENRQSTSPINSAHMRRHAWLAHMGTPEFFRDAYRQLDAALAAAETDLHRIHVRRERMVIDSAYLWRQAVVARQNSEIARLLPSRETILARSRGDWADYLASAFNPSGQELIRPIVEPGLTLFEKLRPEDTAGEFTALAIADSAVVLDGQLEEPVWTRAEPCRFVPKSPTGDFSDDSQIRFAWSTDALYVAIRQTKSRAAHSFEVSVMAPDRTGIQQAAIIGPAGAVQGYFYRYPSTGMEAVKGRTTTGRAMITRGEDGLVAEIRIPWGDLDATAVASGEFLVNVATYATPESRATEFVTSPMLIGSAPGYHPKYHSSVTLAP
jgi:hypothetical protein